MIENKKQESAQRIEQEEQQDSFGKQKQMNRMNSHVGESNKSQRIKNKEVACFSDNLFGKIEYQYLLLLMEYIFIKNRAGSSTTSSAGSLLIGKFNRKIIFS